MELQNFIKSFEFEIEKASKVMKQYLEIKRQNPDCIIFFRLGDFYETYFEDAFVLSKVCGITLTKRKTTAGEILMAGMPHTKAQPYILKLLNEKYKVSVAEQVQSKEELQKGQIIKREIIRTYSPGTLIDGEFLDGGKNNFIASIYKQNNLYGFSYADISTGEFFITQGKLDEIIPELSKVNPAELLLKIKEREIVPFKAVPEPIADIDEIVYKNYPVTLVGGDLFNLEFQNEDLMGCKLGLICANCIINYSKKTQKNFMPKLDVIKKYNISSYLIMNQKTRENLELNRNLSDGKKQGSVFWAVNGCKTLMGKRLLSFWLNEPLFNVDKINERLDGVEELVSNPTVLAELSKILEEINDISRLSSKLSNGTITPKELLSVKSSLECIAGLRRIADGFRSPILKITTSGEILFDFKNIIERTITEEPSDNLKTGNIIKDGANGGLDVIREKIREEEEKLSDYQNELIKKTGIKNLKINYSKNTVYSIDVPIAQVQKFNETVFEAVKKQKTSTVEKYTTKKLTEIENKILSLKMKAQELEYDIFSKLREYSKEMTEPLREFAQSVAVIDVLVSFADTARSGNYCRPKFCKSFSYKVKNGYNPVLLKLLDRCDPLDVEFSHCDMYKILTGANMAGKSSYLRQLAYLIILAQCGSFVPCEFYEAGLTDKIFARMGSFDETLNSNSAFMCEMLEIKDILRNATEESLILLDETGKSTSYTDGICLSFGIIKYISEKIGAKTVLATHFHKLKAENIKGAVNYKFEIVKGEKGEARKILRGSITESGGFEVARQAEIPPKVLEYAESFRGAINKGQMNK